jgi:hypothetical protein
MVSAGCNLCLFIANEEQLIECGMMALKRRNSHDSNLLLELIISLCNQPVANRNTGFLQRTEIKSTNFYVVVMQWPCKVCELQ